MNPCNLFVLIVVLLSIRAQAGVIANEPRCSVIRCLQISSASLRKWFRTHWPQFRTQTGDTDYDTEGCCIQLFARMRQMRQGEASAIVDGFQLPQPTVAWSKTDLSRDFQRKPVKVAVIGNGIKYNAKTGCLGSNGAQCSKKTSLGRRVVGVFGTEILDEIKDCQSPQVEAQQSSQNGGLQAQAQDGTQCIPKKKNQYSDAKVSEATVAATILLSSENTGTREPHKLKLQILDFRVSAAQGSIQAALRQAVKSEVDVIYLTPLVGFEPLYHAAIFALSNTPGFQFRNPQSDVLIAAAYGESKDDTESPPSVSPLSQLASVVSTGYCYPLPTTFTADFRLHRKEGRVEATVQFLSKRILVCETECQLNARAFQGTKSLKTQISTEHVDVAIIMCETDCEAMVHIAETRGLHAVLLLTETKRSFGRTFLAAKIPVGHIQSGTLYEILEKTKKSGPLKGLKGASKAPIKWLKSMAHLDAFKIMLETQFRQDNMFMRPSLNSPFGLGDQWNMMPDFVASTFPFSQFSGVPDWLEETLGTRALFSSANLGKQLAHYVHVSRKNFRVVSRDEFLIRTRVTATPIMAVKHVPRPQRLHDYLIVEQAFSALQQGAGIPSLDLALANTVFAHPSKIDVHALLKGIPVVFSLENRGNEPVSVYVKYLPAMEPLVDIENTKKYMASTEKLSFTLATEKNGKKEQNCLLDTEANIKYVKLESGKTQSLCLIFKPRKEAPGDFPISSGFIRLRLDFEADGQVNYDLNIPILKSTALPEVE